MKLPRPSKHGRETARIMLKVIIMGVGAGSLAAYSPLTFASLIVGSGLVWLLYNAFMPIEDKDQQ